MGVWGCISYASDHAMDLLDRMAARDRKGNIIRRNGHEYIVPSKAKKAMRLILKSIQPDIQAFMSFIERCRAEHKMYWVIEQPCAICSRPDTYELEQYLGAVIYIIQHAKWKRILSKKQLQVAQDIARTFLNPTYLAPWKHPKEKKECLETEIHLLERSINAR